MREKHLEQGCKWKEATKRLCGLSDNFFPLSKRKNKSDMFYPSIPVATVLTVGSEGGRRRSRYQSVCKCSNSGQDDGAVTRVLVQGDNMWLGSTAIRDYLEVDIGYERKGVENYLSFGLSSRRNTIGQDLGETEFWG